MLRSNLAKPHQNNFDLLRFVFAFIVFLVHSHVLSERSELEAFSRWLSSEFAVESFFVVSGYLVVMSFHRSRSIADYFEKRARRIYPAYVAVILLAVVFGAALTSASMGEYLSRQCVRYLGWNLIFLNFLAPALPGLFESNPVQAVNGALWTLKIEVAFYLSVPPLVWFGRRFGALPVLLAVYLAAVTWVLGFERLAEQTGNELYIRLARQLPGQMSYFVAGAAGFYWIERLRSRQGLFLGIALAAALFLVVPVGHALDVLFEPAALALFVLYLALGAPYAGNFGRYGDFSYGIYILHFPILQTLVSLGVFSWNPYVALALAAGLVLLAAILSWHVVEKPFLRKSSHYVVAEVK
jgi:peptidoglycan/LPS O-acetylase OafA/YrhL